MVKHKANGPYEKYIKRVLDVLLSLFILVCFFWLYVILAILVRIKLGSPVIFAQERPGKIESHTGKEKIFELYKFRTMSNQKDEKGRLLPDEIRLTSFGKKLRASS